MAVEASLVLGGERVDDVGYCWNSEVGVKLSVPNIPRGSSDDVEYFVLETLYRGSVTGKKKTIFSKISTKNNFWGAWPFWGSGVSNDKNKCYRFFFGGGNEVPNTVFKFFPQNPHTVVWLKLKKLVVGTHFVPYLRFYWADCFQKQLSSPMSEPAPTMWISW